jgi:hypothetical protein
MTAELRVAKIRSEQFLFTLLKKSSRLPEGGAMWTKASYPFFKEGVRQGRMAWIYLKATSQEDRAQFPIMDPRSFVPFARVIDTSFENVERLIHGDGVKSSLIDGEEIQINFKEIFDNPPNDLKDMLAKGFEPGPSNLIETKTGRKYRNYKMGNPKTWDLAKYQPYFPNITQSDVPKAARVMSQTWGANIAGAALFPVLF